MSAAKNTVPRVVDTVSETQAADLLGWTSANLRSHRLRHEAQLLAEGLGHELRTLVARWSDRCPTAIRAKPRDELVALGLMEHGEDSRRPWPTRQGLEVARRVRNGPRSQSPAPPRCHRMGPRNTIRYVRSEIRAWATANPQILNVDRIREQTIGQQQAADLVGIRCSTLKSLRSKAARAQARIDAGKEEPGDRSTICRSPAWVWAGAEKRYRKPDLLEWIESRKAQDPLERTRDSRRGRLFTDRAATTRMGIAPQCLAGYRSRARRALRQLADDGPKDDRLIRSLEIRSRTAPQHVMVNGRRWYQERDLADWCLAHGRPS